MLKIPKLTLKNLTRTNLTCPSEWEITEEDVLVKLSFRLGVLKIFVDGKKVDEFSKDDFDISSYLSDEDLHEMLGQNDLVKEDVKSS